jgi:rhodanese-related sulfurtransferase
MKPAPTIPTVLSSAEVMERLRHPSLGEWAFLDLREEGEAAEGHPFASTNLPYSRMEIDLPRLVPRPNTPLVLFDGGTGLAERAARQLAALGWTQLSVVAGGAPAWLMAGLPLFKGVHSFSKAFGEWVQHAFHVPEIGPLDLAAQLAAPNAPTLIDGRPSAEHQVFTLPGAMNCPNAELALRLSAMVPADQPVVIHCAGRTRSIIGAQTLRDFGFPNPVAALRDGTQGWELAGLTRETGANRSAPDVSAGRIAEATSRARAVIAAQMLPTVAASTLTDWLADDTRTTYLFDPRSDGKPPPGFQTAPGTTLVQQTDRFIAVKGARVVLWDPLLARSTFAALWLTRMGIEAHVLLDEPQAVRRLVPPTLPPTPSALSIAELATALSQDVTVLDLRPLALFRAEHLKGAIRAHRARLAELRLTPGSAVVLVTDDTLRAGLVAKDLRNLGYQIVGLVPSEPQVWRSAGLATASADPTDPADDPETIRFCAGRHSGNMDDARTYLAWETGLLDRLSDAGLQPWPQLSPQTTPKAGAPKWP